MTTAMTRFIKQGNWIFEVKAVRAIKVDRYGEPYTAIASLSFNGDSAYVDGLMTEQSEQFTASDLRTFEFFCKKLSVSSTNYDFEMLAKIKKSELKKAINAY